MTDKFMEANVELMRQRSAAGVAKYGVTLEREDLTPEQWAQHAIEEALDFANYLQVLKSHLADPNETARKMNQLEAQIRVLQRHLVTANKTIEQLRSQIGGHLGQG